MVASLQFDRYFRQAKYWFLTDIRLRCLSLLKSLLGFYGEEEIWSEYRGRRRKKFLWKRFQNSMQEHEDSR